MGDAHGGDELEEDVVMTKDVDVGVVRGRERERGTDVVDRFPERARKDGGY